MGIARRGNWGLNAVARFRDLIRPSDALAARLPLKLDIRAISLAEGVRAGLSVAVIIVLSEWLRWPPLVIAGLAALWTCLCDAGGPVRRRVPALLVFGLLGAAAMAGFGLLAALPLALVIPVASAAIFCTSFARVWGQPALQIGNLLSVAIVIALIHPQTPAEAAVTAVAFIAGNAWAALITLVIWRLYPFQAARVAVGESYRQLALLAADLRARIRADDASVDWEAHARIHRRAVRDAIEKARRLVTDAIRGRGTPTLRSAHAMIRLETADQIFGILIALSDLLERDTDSRAPAGRMLRLLQPALLVLAASVRTETPLPPDRLRSTITTIAEAAAPPGLRPILEALTERLRIAVTIADPAALVPGSLPEERAPFRIRLLGPVRANLTWKSATLRHALRVAVVSLPALALSLPFASDYSYWLTIVLLLTMQPFFALTWQRAVERTAGTVLGGLLAAALAVVCTTPLRTAAAFFPLAIAAFALRQVSFGAFIAGLTPLIVLLLEMIRPGTSEIDVVLLRALYTVAGGVLAILGATLLWPSWEPERQRVELSGAIGAHARYAAAVLSAVIGEAAASAVDVARRAAGVASNNLETSISRALLEPSQAAARAQLETAMLVDATLRRIAGRLSALSFDPDPRAGHTAEEWRAWRGWISAALDALAQGAPLPAARPAATPREPVARIARQIDLIAGALRRETGGAEASAATLTA